ncbi:gamma-aminobutyric acid type B receptor subunit 2-like isoform X2 [Xenia sp. Carnegie-2017]|uniref:gamma-aminobutyric acid type B receptor subunit 2-like isoform X2 n=1 Tax=Xenia sp. Carnegie-2017 TaxID=2897299 RepID=UPI001F044D27|nr:gamma-aminobutyric acid type B receptor subunit 2-like isoform X2 [Xenia sp. Carnegie-2017]
MWIMLSRRANYFQVLCMLMFFVGRCPLVFGNKTKLVIAGIYTKTHNRSSEEVNCSVKRALELINNSSSLLRNYDLEIVWKYSECENDYGMKALMEHIIESPPNKIAFLGPACYAAAEFWCIALRHLNLIQIPFGLMTSRFSNRKNKFPNICVNPSRTLVNVKLTLKKVFRWTRVFIVEQRADEFWLCPKITKKKKLCLAKKNEEMVISSLKESDARIIVLNMAQSHAEKFLCEAFKRSFNDSETVWILHNSCKTKTWALENTSCTVDDVKQFAKNLLYIGRDCDFKWKGNNIGKVTTMEKKNCREAENNYAYHAIELLAQALNGTEEELERVNESLKEFTYASSHITAIILRKLESLTGNNAKLWIKQMQNNTFVKIAWCENKRKKCKDLNNAVWAGGVLPSDGKHEEFIPCISKEVFWSATGASIVGILTAIFFLWINNRKSSQQYDVLKMSTPPLNNLMLLGAVLAYIFIPINGMTKCTKKRLSFNTSVCKVEVFLMTIAFSLLFGAIFMKTWRIYRIFTNTKLSKKLRFLTNKYLIMMVALLVLFDLLYLFSWNFIHPLEDNVTKHVLPREHKKASKKNLFIHECTSSYFEKWYTGLMLYKGLLIVFGIFITWETRNVSFPGLNDSKYIGMCVYNIFMTTVVILPLKMLAFETDVNISYIILTSSILLCTTLTLVLMFFPKIYPGKTPNETSKATTLNIKNGVVVMEEVAHVPKSSLPEKNH